MAGIGQRVIGAVLLGAGGVVLCAGCGTARAPGSTGSAAPTSTTTRTRTMPPSSPSTSRPTGSTSTVSPGEGGANGLDATINLAQAIDSAGHTRYVSTYGLIILNRSQYGMTLQMTDLAQGRKLLAGARAGHPEWAAVPVVLVKVPYTDKRLRTAQDAVPDASYQKYQLVSVGVGTCEYLSVASSGTRMKDPVSGKNAREVLARTLSRTLGVRVVVTYSPPAVAK